MTRWVILALCLLPSLAGATIRLGQEDVLLGGPTVTSIPTATTTSAPTPTPQRPRLGQEEALLSTATPSVVPTDTPVPTETLIIPPGCVSFTPTITGTRPTATVTPTNTPLCTTVQMVGTVYDVRGLPASQKRVTFVIDHIQAPLPNGCIVRPSTWTVKTDTTGALPADTFAIAGSTTRITIENGIASEVVIPMTGPVDIMPLLYHKPLPTPTVTPTP